MNSLQQNNSIWTIGHSTRSFETFTGMLKSFQIECVVDIRSFPGSRKYPHFNKEALEVLLPQIKINYFHLKELGGRRKSLTDSKNTTWRHVAFRGYADYMETDAFKDGVKKLEKISLEKRTAYMCSEAVWWRCHRSMVSDYLKVHRWNIMHIMGIGKSVAHPYTTPAKIVNGELTYENK